MSSLVTIKLLPEEARKGATGDASALRRVKAELARAVREHDRKLQRASERKQALKLRGGRKEKPKDWPTERLRRAVFDRSEGRCENPRCGRRITWSTFDMDHFVRRGKAPQTPETCWALCKFPDLRMLPPGRPCHERKHAGDPSRVYWLETFLEFAAPRFPKSATVAKVRAELEAERLIAKAEAIRTRAARESEELAARASRAGPSAFTSGALAGERHG